LIWLTVRQHDQRATSRSATKRRATLTPRPVSTAAVAATRSEADQQGSFANR
jgi:hypothetical protein